MARDEGFATALAPGTDVQGYRIESVLGAGGFGITYLAVHIDIGNQVALKEFLPNGIAARSIDGAGVRPVSPAQREDFEWGRARFRDEARTLGRLKHPAIVPVLNYFEANGTAYCVMEYVAGQTLDSQLGPRGTLAPEELVRMLGPLLDGIETVHAAGFLHRDIKPANILLNQRSAPVLIDFGAARQALGAHSRSLTAILSEGYAPYEQYQRDGDQGPWTDIYALGGTLYRCVTGERPPEATRRIEARMKSWPDPMQPAAEVAAGRYPENLLSAIDHSLGVMELERPQSIAELRALIEARGTTAGETLIAGKSRSEQPNVERATIAGAPATLARSSDRRRWPLAVAVSAAILVAGGAVAAYMIMGEHRAEERRIAAVDKQRKDADDVARRQAEDARRGAQEEEQRRRAEAERKRKEDVRRKAEEEDRQHAEAERKRKSEEEARRKAEEERQRREAEETQRKRREEEARRERPRERTSTWEPGKDNSGHTMEVVVGMETAEECRTRCINEPRCVAWTWHSGRDSLFVRQCALHERKIWSREREGAISGEIH
jgi:serine/threonine protein kinase